MESLLLPRVVTITEVVEEAPNVKTFRLKPEGWEFPPYKPGQFVMVSVFGEGEFPAALASTFGVQDLVEVTVRKMGRVTTALHRLWPGAQVGLRGPFGKGWTDFEVERKGLAVIGGGIGFPPLRALVNYTLANREKFPEVYILYGARSPEEMVYKKELERWAEEGRAKVVLTVDNEHPGWKGRVGLVPNVLKEEGHLPSEPVAAVCGPPVMIRHTAQALLEVGLPPERILVSLELKMQCGIGKCERCLIGPKHVCTDGPVFSWEEVSKLTAEI